MTETDEYTYIERVNVIMREMQDKIDTFETRLKNIYKYSNPAHIHETPTKKQVREENFNKLVYDAVYASD